MAVRLSKNVKRNNDTSKPGFNLSFSPCKTYDLDEIIANHQRKSGDRKLRIQVKDAKVIGEEIMNRILNDIEVRVISNLGTEEVKEKISNIIQAAYSAYPNVSNTDITNKNIIGFINFNLNKLMNNTWTQFSIKYTIELDSSVSGTVQYKVDDQELNSLFTKYYDQYAAEIQKDLEAVDEGGLAISNDKRVQINPSYADYQKYLLDEKKSTVQTTIGTSNYKTVISWEDYSEDNREQDEVLEVPEFITESELDKILSETRTEIWDTVEQLKDQIQNMSGGHEGGIILDPEYDTLLELGEKLKELDRVPIVMEVSDDD